MSNKVKFGLRNVHYATYTVAEGVITYDTPVKVPGAVEISLEPRGDMVEFYADDMLYYSAQNNQGYDGTLNIALIPQSFAIDALGEELDEDDDVLTEKTTSRGNPFALMFEFDGDVKATRHVLYNCTANRPTVSGETKTDTVDPQTDELTFVSSPRETDYAVKTKTTASTPERVYNDWYNAVYEKTDDVTPPTVGSVTPEDNDTGVSVTATITWEFSEEVRPSTIDSDNVFVKNSLGSKVNGTLSISQNGKIVTFTPNLNLETDEQYDATVTTRVKDYAGNALQTQFDSSFTTES